MVPQQTEEAIGGVGHGEEQEEEVRLQRAEFARVVRIGRRFVASAVEEEGQEKEQGALRQRQQAQKAVGGEGLGEDGSQEGNQKPG